MHVRRASNGSVRPLNCGVMRHRALIASSLLFAALGAVAQDYGLSFPAGGRTVLSVANAPAVLEQCSRETPQGVSGFWEPSDAAIETLERALVEHLESLGSTEGPSRGVPYGRQYIGFTRDGMNLIYGNFFPHTGRGVSPNSSRAYSICDGGSTRWGIVYDPASGRFSELKFNGVT
jgi:hypothetical protein